MRKVEVNEGSMSCCCDSITVHADTARDIRVQKASMPHTYPSM